MIELKEHVPLAPFTTFKIGGEARYFASARNEEDIREAFEWAREQCLPIFPLGGGSNVLFADKGFPGLVMKMENTDFSFDGLSARVEAGADLFTFIKAAAERGLSGLERMAGIPGSVGGALRGNAGAFGTEIGSAVEHVRAFNVKTLETGHFIPSRCEFAYRSSYFKTHPDWLVLSAVLRFSEGDPSEIGKTMEETVRQREKKHPQDAQCAGSFFMNPTVTDKKLIEHFRHDMGMEPRGGKLPAGWLIDEAGLRGKRVGDAMVSDRHPNYIINVGHATADDVLMLASIIKQRIRAEFSIQLREEVQWVGF